MLPAFLISGAMGIMVTRSVTLGDPSEKIEAPDILSLEIGFDLIPLVDKDKGAALRERIQDLRSKVAQDMGIVIPKLRTFTNKDNILKFIQKDKFFCRKFVFLDEFSPDFPEDMLWTHVNFILNVCFV